MKTLLFSALVAVAMICLGSSAEARIINPNNPYKSFNVSGINYGSMQWEKSHNGMWSGHRTTTTSQPRLFRRWR